MGDFLSGFITLADERIILRDMRSHSETARIAGIRPDTAREFEWTTDDKKDLIVRVHPDDPHDANWYRACILAAGNTRARLISAAIRSDPRLREYLVGTTLWLDRLQSAEHLVLPPGITTVWLSGRVRRQLAARKVGA